MPSALPLPPYLLPSHTQAVADYNIWVPNLLGAVLGVVQCAFKLVYRRRKASLAYAGTEASSLCVCGGGRAGIGPCSAKACGIAGGIGTMIPHPKLGSDTGPISFLS